ncbi:phage tail assembly protein T [Streptomyces sp. C10-9-1]|uniref:phage tail assembly protein T n=1 Tax=Streptomyces sp. C10-9-1 TaxID=1859285 RepID=UPI003F4A5759
MAYAIPPGEVLDRFTEEELVRLLAYQNLYGPAGPRRLDVLFARLGMDVAAPHMKKGKRPRLRDHLVVWSRAARPQRTGRELLAVVRELQAAYDADEKPDAVHREKR